MMELISDSFDIRCCECGEQITIFKDDLDPDVSFFDHGENGMGIETIYEIRHELSCPQCGNNIEITITGNEYPEGAYDYGKAGRCDRSAQSRRPNGMGAPHEQHPQSCGGNRFDRACI